MEHDGFEIGELAERAEVNLQSLRYYEREKLLHELPRLSSVHQARAGHRVYAGEIRELLSLGINRRRERTEVRGLALAKIADIDNKIRTLKAMKTALQHLTERCSGCGPASECLIVASIDSEEVLK